MAKREQFNRGMILPTLIKQLRSILQQYPDDGQILKELIQNAEDAQARRIVFLLDSTTYSAHPGKLHHPELAAYQGPALYVYNDAVFTAEDWKGITMLSDSVKEKDVMKVGRFGLGFKSVFHLTDLPSIFSGNGIGFLDPHERFFRTGGDRGYPTSAYLWDLNEDRESIRNIPDQFLPYFWNLFGVTRETFERGIYNGTMFRFPLRLEGMESDLCETKYSPQKVRELFRSLETDGHIMLLFLKSLECIEVYEKTSNKGTPTKILSICIAEALRKSVQEKRLQLINDIQTQCNGNISFSTSVTYPLNVELQRYKNTEMQSNTTQNTELSYSPKPVETSQWVISQYYAGQSELGSTREISNRLGLLPWVGIALQITDQSNSENLSYLTKAKGHVFCFLPLPLEEASPTGLRVHVHGYFAVDSNRRHIKWPTADQRLDQLTDEALLWNVFLVNKLVVKALVKLALYVANPCNNLHHSLIFDIIPDHVTPQWKQLADEFHKELPNLNIFYSQSSGGKWVNCRNALFDNCEDESVLQELIRRILIQNEVCFVSAPKFLKKHFVTHVSPLKTCQAFKAIQTHLPLSEQEKYLLLEYFLESFPRGTELIGIRLVPLEDGNWTAFKNNHEEKVYLESSEHTRAILPNLDGMFVKHNISVLQEMKNLAKKNVTQIMNLEPQSVAKLLHLVFPVQWRSVNEVSLRSAPHLSHEWLTNLWKYLTRHFPSNLKQFEDFLILPIGNGLVTRLRSQTPIILASHHQAQLAKGAKSMLTKLGLKVIDELPRFVLGHQSVIGSYVLPPDATNVLSAMNKLYLQGGLSVSSMGDSNKKLLQNFLASGLAGKSKATVTYKELLMTLPIFKTLDGSGFKGSEYVSVYSVNMGAPSDINLPVKLPSMFIDLKENLVRDLAVNLGVKQKSTVEILENYIFPEVIKGSYNLDSIKMLMSFVCDNFSRFLKESRNDFRSSASKVRFIQKQDGNLVTPGDVFDKSDKVLSLLFGDDDVFPVGEFANPKYVQILSQLGLKTEKSVTADDLLRIAEKFDSSTSPDLSRAQVFLKFLESKSQLLTATVTYHWSFCSLSKALSDLRWIKPESCRPANYAKSLEFLGEAQSKQLVLPSEVCSSRFDLVVGSVKSTVNVSKTPKIADCFGWSNHPNVTEVVEHLSNAVSSYADKFKNEFQFIVKAVYEFLNNEIAETNYAVRLDQLNYFKWIWTGENFVSSDKVVRTKPFMDLQPHVYQLPADLRQFSYLWKYFGIAETVDLIKILNEIHLLHTTSDCSQSEVKRDVQVSIAILNNISNMENLNEILNELLVPVRTNNEKLCLKPIQEVTYCEKEWFQRGLDLVDSDLHLVHPLLSPGTAEALKIHSIISRVIDAEELEVGFESYGQHEGLTTRLNNILKDYTDGMAVLKELVQNADDAGATEVKFLYDQRQNNDSKILLLDKGMAELQGPALWAYNNAVFTSQDFENLVKLSGATKQENNEKIGRFGLGFNAVYNLTDVPSLVSQNFAVFLDPHTKYLGRVIRDKNKPGIKLDIGNKQTMLQPLKDQFKPYQKIFGCDFSTAISTKDHLKKWSYHGTLFRFPLRTAQQAAASDICKKYYNHQEMMGLIELLSGSANHLLLFTQNVSKITVFHLPDNVCPNDIEEWFTIEKSLERTIRSLNQCSLSMENYGVSELNRESSILKVANRILNPSKKSKNQTSKTQMSKIESSFVLKVACQTSATFMKLHASSSGVSESHWLVSSCLGNDSSLAMARNNKDLIPVGGVAAKLRRNADSYEPISLASGTRSPQDSGLLYCFLPLPIRSCFPVHINGSFALTSSRTHIYESSVKDKYDLRFQWNEVLIKDAITEAYLILLEDLLKVCQHCNSYILWPVHTSLKEAGCFHWLTDSLYRRIFDSGPKILRENGLLLSMSECRYLEPKFRQEAAGETALTVFRKMISVGFQMTDIPTEVYATVAITSALQQLEARKVTKINFFQNFFLPNIGTVEAQQRNELILYALFDQDLIGLLQNIACIPVKPWQILKTCSQLVHPQSFLAVLFEDEDECFPDIKTISGTKLNDVHRKLVDLGMRERNISWKETAERCAVVTKYEQLVTKRLEAIIKLMNSKASSFDHSDLPSIEQIKAIQFLPTAVKPTGFPLRWKGEDMKYASCNESFLSNVKNLVCCLYPIINDHKIFGYEDQKLKQLLGLASKSIDQNDLLLQLKNVLESNGSSGSMNKLAADGMKHVKEICNELYIQFEKLASRNELMQSTIDQLLEMQSILTDASMVFMYPRNCALNLVVPSECLLPYLAQIPKSMTTLSHLLNKLQIKQSFQLEDYISVLQQLHTRFADMPLKEKELKMAVCIVNLCLEPEIAKLATDNENSVDLTKIYIPDMNGILFPAESLCYNNCPWIAVDDHHFCNDNITPRTAKVIGMKTIREDVIDKYSIGIPFGQKEKLVSRIRRILSGYPFDKEVLKEMLQNADDANATKIHFINDRRQLKTDRVFEDKWKPLQGPALCIFNNKPFTKEDIIGIQNLGEGSKSEDPTKTGQYGVGFNCVYHMTDAPAFLTSEVDGDKSERVLCAFDPTLKFVPGAKEASPGRKMNNIEKLKEKFPDVFDGYFEKDYGSLRGTMFRLALRGKISAAQPDCITNKAVTSDDLDKLFGTFKTDMYESLLFLNSIEEIHLRSTNSELSGNLITSYIVQVEMTDEAKDRRKKFNEEVKRLSKALKDRNILLKDVGVTETSYELITKDSDGQRDTWQIIQRFGFEDPSCVPETLNDAYSRGDIGLLPRCGVAHLKSTTRKTVKQNRRLFCFLPLPIQIHFPSHINGHFALDYETRRNLWKDENGGYSTEWNKCLMKHIIAPCYCSLLLKSRDFHIAEGPITNSVLSQYNTLLPDLGTKDGIYMTILCTAIYERIGKKNLAVLPVRWPENEDRHLWVGPCGMDEATLELWIDMGWDGSVGTNGILGYFDSLNIQIPEPPESSAPGYRSGFCMVASSLKTEQKRKRAEIVRDILVASGFLLINCPMSIAGNFKSAQVKVEEVSPNAVLSFYASYDLTHGLCRLQGLPKPLKDTLFKDVETLKLVVAYCTGCDNYKNRLFGLPFLLTADGYLRCFEPETIKYEPYFNEIVPHIQDQFFNYHIFQTLKLAVTTDIQLSKAFTVEEFAKALPALLPAETFKAREKPVSIETLKNILKEKNLRWLAHLWKFLFSCQKKLETEGNSKKASESLKNIILPLLDWCLLPVNFKQKEYLFPIQKSRGVIKLNEQSVLQRTLISCLQKIGIPQPLFTYFSCAVDTDSFHMYCQFLGSIDDASSVVLALAEVLKFGAIEAKLNSLECEELCRYLAKSLELWKGTADSISTIKQLPIFTTMYDKQVALLNSCVYVIPSNIPKTDMESWTAEQGIIFLKSSEVISELLKYLGCISLTETEVYCSFIFQHFELLSKTGQKVHIRHVKDNLLSKLMKEPYKEKIEHKQERERECNALQESLQKLAFIPTDDDSYVCASEFFDNQNVVFKLMQEPVDFPPAPFDSFEWNDFLKKCGMISVVNQTMFCDYACQVEQKAQEVIDEKLTMQSRALVEHLFSREDINDTSFMNKVKSIRFVEQYILGDIKTILHGGCRMKNRSGQNMFIPFGNSITPENVDLIWTVQNILPELAVLYFRKSQARCANLDIQEKPKPENVAKHIKQLCTKWMQESHKLKPHAESMALVLKKCYILLKSGLRDDASGILTDLKNTACIFDLQNCLFVQPGQVVLRWKPNKEIIPYLIRNPDELGEFNEFFKLLGSTLENATIEQYCMVLEMIHDEVKDNELHANEKEAVCKATHGFFKLLKQSKEPITLQRELFLPGTDGRLHRSSEIIVNNDFKLSQRMEHFDQTFLIDLRKECGISILDFELESLIKKLPAFYQPTFLTSVVMEVMDESFTEEDFNFVKMLQKRLHSDQMKEGIMRIAWHGVKENEKENEQRITEAVEELQNIRFIGVNIIRTFLVYKGNRINGSDRTRHFHIKEELVDGRKCCTVFVGSKATESHGEATMRIFYYRIAKIVSQFTKNIIEYSSLIFLQHIIECREHMIDEVLECYGIKPIQNLQRQFRPNPGQFVPLHFHHLLKQDILLLKIGDYVALETDDPADNISTFTEDEATGSPGDDDDGIERRSMQPTYILVKIIGVLDEDKGPTIATYKIEDGNGIKTVSAALLYAFHRTVTNAENVDAILETDDTEGNATITLDEAKHEIRQTLLDTWKLREDIRRKFIKRLLLRWHPDKNLDNMQMATEATQYIFEVIDKLSKGISLEEKLPYTAQSSSSDSYSSSNFAGAYYSYISKRARKHREVQQCFQENYARNRENVEERRRQDFIKSFSIVSRNPQPGEGRRWLRQAEWDLKSMINDGPGGKWPSPEWACFKCYQAAKKALKGAQYARDSNSVTGKELKDMVGVFEKPELRDWVRKLQHLLTSPSYMQYPKDHHQPMIPHEAFNDEIVQLAQVLGQNIVDWCKRYID